MTDYEEGRTLPLFYENTSYAISPAIISALIEQLDASCVVRRNEIVMAILAANQTSAPMPVSEKQSQTRLPEKIKVVQKR